MSKGRTIFIIFTLCFFVSNNLFAYEIVAQDKAFYVFKDGNFKKDSHLYKVYYRVDEQKKELRVIKEVNMITGKQSAEGLQPTIFEIVPQSDNTLGELYKQKECGDRGALKAVRFNPVIEAVEVITFCGGEFYYSKTQNNWINLSYGTYEISF